MLTEERLSERQSAPERQSEPAPPAPPPRGGGVDGNERLTAATAVVLLVLLAALGVTILFDRGRSSGGTCCSGCC